MDSKKPYRGRLAPTPSGFLHVGHARTFAIAHQRAQKAGGTLVFRSEDIDRSRCRDEFEASAVEDLAWLGIEWQEGIDCGGPFAPYRQSDRFENYTKRWVDLVSGGYLYSSELSRNEILAHNPRRDLDGGILFPDELRGAPESGSTDDPDPEINWRFRITNGVTVKFRDEGSGMHEFVAGEDFGDFLVWRKSREPAYELAVVADDIDMKITEVVRGEDLLLSTARQILLYQALGAIPPEFYHAPLVFDRFGDRLSKTAGSIAIRGLRDAGWNPPEVLAWKDDESSTLKQEKK